MLVQIYIAKLQTLDLDKTVVLKKYTLKIFCSDTSQPTLKQLLEVFN